MSIILSILSLLSSIAGFANQVNLVRRYGLNHDLDIVYALLSFPMFASGVISSSVVLLLVEKFTSKKEKFTHCVIGYMWLSIIILTVGITSSIILCNIQLQQPKQNINILPTIIAGWLFTAITIINSVYVAGMNSMKHFLCAALTNILPSITTIIFVEIAHCALGVSSISVGTALGAAIQLLINANFFHNHDSSSSLRYFKSYSLKLLKIPYEHSKSVGLVAISGIGFSCAPLLDSLWLSVLNDGDLSSLGVALRIIIGVGGAIVLGLATILLPSLVKINSIGNSNDFRNKVLTSIQTTLFVSSSVAVFLIIFSKDFTYILFKNDKTTDLTISSISENLRHYSVGMIFMTCSIIINRALVADAKYHLLANLGIITVLAHFLCSLSIFFVDLKTIALANSYSISWLITFLVGTRMVFHNKYLLVKSLWLLRFLAVISTSICFTSYLKQTFENYYNNQYFFLILCLLGGIFHLSISLVTKLISLSSLFPQRR